MPSALLPVRRLPAAPSSSPIDVQLDDVAIGIGDMQLFPRRDVVGALQALDAMRAKMLAGALIVRDAKRHVAVAGVDRPRPPQRQRMLVDDEVQLPSVAQLVPRPAERER